MKYKIKPVSCMEKVLSERVREYGEIRRIRAMKGQRVCFQVCIIPEAAAFLRPVTESPFPVSISLVESVVVDAPATDLSALSDGYLLTERGYLPDVLIPLEERGGIIRIGRTPVTLWVRVDVPYTAEAGEQLVSISFEEILYGGSTVTEVSEKFSVEICVADAVRPDPDVIYTRWFYADCIATAHGAEMFSERHWSLIEKYVAAAADVGINMILLPIHTPPLDTAVGTARPCVQLVDIELTEEGCYRFGFSRLERFVKICLERGIRYFEAAHLFSQWGAAATPNIMVREKGQESCKFGWHVPSDSPLYAEFLREYLPAVIGELERLGVLENTYFHISDEPGEGNIETYTRVLDIIKPLVGEARIMDALSSVEFWRKGLVEVPVTCADHIHDFLECPVEEQWVYYCCGPQRDHPNSFIALPSHRIRIIGYLIYKYGIRGFLHWGFNFYNSDRSLYTVDPYLTTSSDGALPSGDGFIVYPGKEGVRHSLRGEVMYRALEDVALCRRAEAAVGRDRVVEIIDREAGESIRFNSFPRDDGYFDRVSEALFDAISL